MASTYPTGYYPKYKASLRGRETEGIIKELFRDSHGLTDATKLEDTREDLDFRMNWKGQKIAVSLKDESAAPKFAAKRKMETPDLYFEINRRNASTGEWERSSWFHGENTVTHYMIAWWLEDHNLLELRIYNRREIYSYLQTRKINGEPTEIYRPTRRKSKYSAPMGWHKIYELNSYTAKTQIRKYDNAECGYIPSNAVPCDLLRFRYNEVGSLEEIPNE